MAVAVCKWALTLLHIPMEPYEKQNRNKIGQCEHTVSVTLRQVLHLLFMINGGVTLTVAQAET